MDVFTHLRAGTDGGPCIDHGALVNVGADIDVTGHQNSALGDIAATTCHSGRHHANTAGFHFFFAQMGKFSRNLVIKAQVACFDNFVVFQTERQQHRFFDPLVCGPLANRLAGGYPHTASVHLGNHVFHRIANFLRGVGRVD